MARLKLRTALLLENIKIQYRRKLWLVLRKYELSTMNSANYNHFYYFYIIAKLEGVSTAAKHLNTSQSSLSSQIKVLESQLGFSLFKKSGRKIQLTAEGREIFQYCRRSFENFEEMFDQIRKRPTAIGARITVGVSTDIDRSFATDALAKVIKQYPRGNWPVIHLISQSTEQILQSLKVGEIDFAMLTRSILDPDMMILKEFKFPVGAYGTKEYYEEYKNNSLDLFSKKNELPLCLPARQLSLRSEIDSFLLKKDLRPKIVFESNMPASVIRAAADGLGIALLPEPYVLREIKNNKFFSLSKKSLWTHRMILITERNNPYSAQMLFAEKLIAELTLLSPS